MELLILPGDGIGPECMAATLKVLQRANEKFHLGLTFGTEDIGLVTLKTMGTTMPPGLLDRAKQSAGVLLGPISHNVYPPRDQGGVNVSSAFRIGLDLYANIRPSRSRPGLSFAGKDMDLVIFRENTEGFYADRNMFAGIGEFMPTEDMALAMRKITARACRRIARAAFEAAARRHKKVTAVHKANVLRVSDGLFLKEVRAVARDFPDVELKEVLVDAMAALLIRDPSRFDVIVTTNMFGDILSDEASELSGSLGLAGSLNAGDTMAVGQAQHGSAPDIAGQDRANPVSLMLSAAMLLDWIAARHQKPAMGDAAVAISKAIDTVLLVPEQRTCDLPGGTLGTQAFAEVIASVL